MNYRTKEKIRKNGLKSGENLTSGVFLAPIFFVLFAGILVFSGSPVSAQTAPSLTGSCFPDSPVVEVGQSVAWTATASGGTGSYLYSWSGTDGFGPTRNSEQFWTRSRTYRTPGLKTANVRISSGSQTVVRTCSVEVVPELHTPPAPPTSSPGTSGSDLEVTCSTNPQTSQIGEEVTWSASASGGTGSYSFNWIGTAGLSGDRQTVTHVYDSAGTHSADVHVVSGNQSASASCSVEIVARSGTGEENENGETVSPVTPGEATVIGSGIGRGIFFVVFFPLFIIWSVLIAYIFYNIGYRRAEREFKKEKTQEKIEKSVFDTKPSAQDNEDSDLDDVLDDRSKKNKVLIGERGLQFIRESAEGDKNKALEILDKLIEEKGRNGDEDWHIIDTGEVKEFIENLS